MEKTKNILILTYWSYDDALVQTYVLPYARIIQRHLPAGSRIFLVTLEKDPAAQPKHDEADNIRNIRIPYLKFGTRAAFSWIKDLFQLRRLIRKENIAMIHAWCSPAGMIGYILSLWSGKPLIIDSYEPHAEAMVENGEWKKGGLAFRILFLFEKLQTKKARYLIAAAQGMKEYARKKYGHEDSNFFVKPACVDLQKFSGAAKKDARLLHELGFEDKIVGVYAGKFGGIYLKEELFDLIKVCEDHWSERFRLLLLSPHSAEEIRSLREKAGIREETIVHRFVPHKEIPQYMGLADFAITPVKPVPSKRYCSPVKDGEYWALGLPVIITPDISDDSFIIKDKKAGAVIEALDKASYLQAVKETDAILCGTPAPELYKKIRKIAEEYRNYSIAEEIYKKIYHEF